ncbi:hypothetical protein HCJ92_21360, partial [Streptomyces sp. ventii]|nr:hypothetical protein [Streptomyces spiramenti]
MIGTTPVADRLARLAEEIVGEPPSFRLRAWDGSEAGPPDAPLVEVRHRRALRRLLWRPDRMGLARAWVAGEITVPGDLYDVLERLTLPEHGPRDRRAHVLGHADGGDGVVRAVADVPVVLEP